MRRFRDWIIGWYNTLLIKYRDPALFAFLCDEKNFEPGNFTEVRRPEAE